MTVRQRDTADVGAALGELDDALFQLAAIQEDSEKEGYTVDQAAYADAQEQAQQALVNLMTAGDALVGELDEFVTEDGTSVPLPNPPLERGPDGLPQFPGGGG